MTTAWGIIRYAPGTGSVPEDDIAAFDGWYSEEQDAREIYESWKAEWGPKNWIIALIIQADAYFGPSQNR